MIEKYDIIKEVVESINPSIRFLFEDWEGVLKDNTLISFNKSKDGTKYPFILMHSDVGEELRNDTIGLDNEFTAIFYIVANSKLEYNKQQRIENVFTPIINPLFDKLLVALFDNNKIRFEESNLTMSDFIPCKTENIYKGQIIDKKSNVASEIIDAMKITINLKIQK